MKTKRRRQIVALALVAAVLSPSAVRASDRVEWKPGARVAVELVNGPPVAGTIRTVEPGGLIVEPDAGEPIFVAFSNVSAFRDPDSGKVIAHRRVMNKHLKTACITAVVFVGVTVLLHALGPWD